MKENLLSAYQGCERRVATFYELTGIPEIDGKEYDICAECWDALAEKLRGKGRVKKSREIVLLPPPRLAKEDDEPKPMPGEPPKIWGAAEGLN